MNYLEEATKKDMQGKYFPASQLYEKVIQQKEPPIESFINLFFIYWESNSQRVFTNGTVISENFNEIPLYQYLTILDQALKKFPNNSELYFWLKYFPFAGLGESFSEEDCLDILRQHGESLVPYFFLYLFDNEKYKSQRDKLLEECLKLPTAKNLWIKSIIE